MPGPSNPGTADTETATREGGELDFSTFLTGTANDVKGYIGSQKRYLELHLSERAGVLLSRLIANVVLSVAVGFALLFLNVAIAIYLGQLLGSAPLGFLIVAALYLLLLGIFHLWWASGGRDRFVLDRINDLTENDDVQKP